MAIRSRHAPVPAQQHHHGLGQAGQGTCAAGEYNQDKFPTESWGAYLACAGSAGQWLQGTGGPSCRNCKCPAGFSFIPGNPEFSPQAAACRANGGQWVAPNGRDTVQCTDASGNPIQCKDIFGKPITVFTGCRQCAYPQPAEGGTVVPLPKPAEGATVTPARPAEGATIVPGVRPAEGATVVPPGPYVQPRADGPPRSPQAAASAAAATAAAAATRTLMAQGPAGTPGSTVSSPAQAQAVVSSIMGLNPWLLAGGALVAYLLFFNAAGAKKGSRAAENRFKAREDITNQRDLRRLFWETFPGLDRRKITDYSGTGRTYKTDTRVAWVDWIDSLARDGVITESLASRATLED